MSIKNTAGVSTVVGTALLPYTGISATVLGAVSALGVVFIGVGFFLYHLANKRG